MTKVRGVADLESRDMTQKLARMAAPLPVIHTSRELHAVGVKLKMNPRRYDWVHDPGVRRAAEELVAKPPDRIARVATHGDYQHFNMLWSRGRLSGVLDWSGVWIGPPEVDTCHCRLNLAVLYSPLSRSTDRGRSPAPDARAGERGLQFLRRERRTPCSARRARWRTPCR